MLAHQRMMSHIGNHRALSTSNPLVVGSSPTHPTSEAVFQDQTFRFIVYSSFIGARSPRVLVIGGFDGRAPGLSRGDESLLR